MTGGPTPSHWRQAMAIAAQMPPDEVDALLVLQCVEEILRLSFDPPPTAPIGPGDDQVLRFPGGSRSPRRRSTSNGSPSDLPK
jgi:hypothetical protein